jgi:L-lactate dehydrogenase (cytochrome)
MPPITCIEDLRQLHRARVPRMFWDYCESGSYTEQTFRDNCSDFGLIRLRQRVARDISGRSLATEMLGRPVAMPLALSPVGSCGMQSADGEIKAARAAAALGVPFTLSTFSICSIEDVAEATGQPFWFQLYVMRDEDFVDGLIERARKAGCEALVITLDLQILGQRHKDIKNGLTAPPRLTPRNLWDMACHPRWSAGMARTSRRTFRNVVGHAKGVHSLQALNAWSNENFDPHLDWAKVRKLRDKWGGKVILKGILEPEDAKAALDVGADAILVSNHGGRQLDGALSTIRALEPIVKAVDGRAEVYLDGGVRSGQDVLKAMALGAKGAFIGRSYLYGLGAMGEAGVRAAIEVIGREMDVTLALAGVQKARDFSREDVLVPKGFAGDWA